jgi:hypothetical protein
MVGISVGGFSYLSSSSITLSGVVFKNITLGTGGVGGIIYTDTETDSSFSIYDCKFSDIVGGTASIIYD